MHLMSTEPIGNEPVGDPQGEIMSIRVRAGRLAGAAAVAAMMLSACTATVDSPQGSGAPADGGDVLNLVGYAVPKAGNNAVQKLWAETDEGAGVSWVESYGASGVQPSRRGGSQGRLRSLLT